MSIVVASDRIDAGKRCRWFCFVEMPNSTSCTICALRDCLLYIIRHVRIVEVSPKLIERSARSHVSGSGMVVSQVGVVFVK